MVLCCLLMAVNATAQSQVSSVIEEFIDHYAENIAPEIYHSPKRISYSKHYRFDLPDKQKNVETLEELARLFKYHMKDAYQYRELKAKMPTGNLQRVVYGDNNEFTLDFFKYANRNYIVMLVKDTADISSRYCYALTWYKAGSHLMGSVYEIYGRDPQYVADAPQQHPGDVSMSNMNDLMNGTTIYINENGRVSFQNSQPKDSALTQMDDLEFLKQFGNLRGALIGQSNTPTLAASLVNKLLELCKNYAYVLDLETREVCLQEIRRMVKLGTVKDPYVNGLLSRAGDYLNKPEKPKGK